MALNNEQDRLSTLYRDLSDTQLLDLAEDSANLTDAAQQALRAEMQSRHLHAAAPEAPATKAAEYAPDLVSDLNTDGLVALITFYNGMDLGLACDHLGDADIELAVKPFPGTDISPPAFQVRVAPVDRNRAEAILRATMGLFPLQEVDSDAAGAEIGDGEMVILGEFPDLAETQQVVAALHEAGIEYRMTPPEDDGELDEPGYSVEVRAEDLDRGLGVVADALGLE